MPSRSPAADHGLQEETAGRSYFAPLAQGRYFLLTTSRPKGAPVSARVPGVVDGARAYVRVWAGSGTGRRHLRHAGQLQVTACDALGLVSYGPPRYADVRPLAGEEAGRAAAQLASRYPVKRGVLAWLLRRKPVYYELTVP